MTAVSRRGGLRGFTEMLRNLWLRTYRQLRRVRMESDDRTGFCIFCSIASGSDPFTEILCQDEEVVCFRDIDPAAPHHYLVVPHEHIADCTVLRPEHTPLVVRMANMGLAALEANGFTDFTNIRLGFHVPPRISVPHLHLHVLAPQTHMYDDAIYRCLATSHWFLTVEQLLRKLNPKDVLWSPGNGVGPSPKQPVGQNR
ncbi:hypothetical protein ACEWY4_022014 [Coilia grayii]|uniref:HIT domain-containing protein n=1 Tax=Coilia grayii TaxID=363190 RepID=A0ABD1J4T7_9TELE